MKRQRMIEDAPQRYSKRRHLKDLDEAEVKDIIAATRLPYNFHKDVAKQYRISAKLVGDLVRESEKHPERLEARWQRRRLREEKKDAVEDVAVSLLNRNIPIQSTHQIKLVVEEDHGHVVNLNIIRKVLRRDLRMKYRTATGQPVQTNLERCLVQRQQYSIRMLSLLESGRRIINVDQSWLN